MQNPSPHEFEAKMKLTSAAFLCLLCLPSHAEIIQHSTAMDTPSVSVLAGQQRNGTVAIEQLFSHTTTSAQDALSHSPIALNHESSFGGTQQRAGLSAFNIATAEQLPSKMPPLPSEQRPLIPPIVAAVPEPASYALMALGLLALFLARRQRHLIAKT